MTNEPTGPVDVPLHVKHYVVHRNRSYESRDFYQKLLGFRVAMDLNWIVTLVSPGNSSAQISLVRATKPVLGNRITLTVEVGNVDAIHAKAESRGDAIVYPLTDEPWGVRRFHVRDPNGVIVNVMSI